MAKNRCYLLITTLHILMTLITGVPLANDDAGGGGTAVEVTTVPTVASEVTDDMDYYEDEDDYEYQYTVDESMYVIMMDPRPLAIHSHHNINAYTHTSQD